MWKVPKILVLLHQTKIPYILTFKIKYKATAVVSHYPLEPFNLNELNSNAP